MLSDFFPYRNLLHVSLKMNIGSIKEITFETCRTRNMDDAKKQKTDDSISALNATEPSPVYEMAVAS